MKKQFPKDMWRFGWNVISDNEVELSFDESLYQNIGAGGQHDDLGQIRQKIFEDRQAQI